MLEAVNKKDGVFTEADEQTLLSLADFCGLLVTSSRMREDFISTENRLKVATDDNIMLMTIGIVGSDFNLGG